jgi:hypothetical protein
MRRWIAQLKNRWRARRARDTYATLKSFTLSLSNHNPSRSTLQSLLNTLDVSKFERFRNSHAVGVTINPFYATIDAYNREIKIINSQLAKVTALPTTWATLDNRATGLDQFFTSADGFYLNVQQALASFKRDALILCALMETSDNAALGIDEHNLRMLTRILVNLRHLVVTLIDVSFVIDE